MTEYDFGSCGVRMVRTGVVQLGISGTVTVPQVLIQLNPTVFDEQSSVRDEMQTLTLLFSNNFLNFNVQKKSENTIPTLVVNFLLY